MLTGQLVQVFSNSYQDQLLVRMELLVVYPVKLTDPFHTSSLGNCPLLLFTLFPCFATHLNIQLEDDLASLSAPVP